MSDDATLLQDYARNGSEAAFAEVVRRHLPLVYPTALRQANGDAHRAQDITQIVFTALARDAPKLSRHAALAGWLHTAARHTAIDLARAERRRRQREEANHLMETASAPGPSVEWEQLRPVLDEVLGELDAPDREAVLLRFFEDRPFAAVGERLRVSEDTARKRVDRALDKLGALLDRRGIRSTGSALALLLASPAAHATPPGIAATITAAAIASAGASAAATGGSGFAFFIMSSSKTIAVITSSVALLAIGTVIYQASEAEKSAATPAASGAEREAARVQAPASTPPTRPATPPAAKERELPPANAGQPAPAAAPVTPPAATAAGKTVADLYDNAQFQDYMARTLRLEIEPGYAPLVKALNLSPDQGNRFIQLLVDKRMAIAEIKAVALSQGVSATSETIDELKLQSEADFEARIRQEIGPTNYEAYKRFTPELGKKK